MAERASRGPAPGEQRRERSCGPPPCRSRRAPPSGAGAGAGAGSARLSRRSRWARQHARLGRRATGCRPVAVPGVRRLTGGTRHPGPRWGTGARPACCRSGAGRVAGGLGRAEPVQAAESEPEPGSVTRSKAGWPRKIGPVAGGHVDARERRRAPRQPGSVAHAAVRAAAYPPRVTGPLAVARGARTRVRRPRRRGPRWP